MEKIDGVRAHFCMVFQVYALIFKNCQKIRGVRKFPRKNYVLPETQNEQKYIYFFHMMPDVFDLLTFLPLLLYESFNFDQSMTYLIFRFNFTEKIMIIPLIFI